jgi:hypothetical protein
MPSDPGSACPPGVIVLHLSPPPLRTQRKRLARTAATIGLGLAALAQEVALAATLPPHRSLRVLIVSDEVNPHGLPDAELTQPGELSAALVAPGSGLQLDAGPEAVFEVPTNQIELATARLSLPLEDPAAYDVLIYFAHRIPDNGMNDVARQQAFTAAVEAFLERGGGVVSFHHGAYLLPGKEEILELIGGTASGAVVWNTTEGQNVINVAPVHFVTCYAESYAGTTAYADPARGVPAGVYPIFNNTPDERYLSFELHPTADQVEVLFGSDFVQAGSTHLLGFTHTRAAWRGSVVAYQPGEHQPMALDAGGPNFQILANAIVWAAGAVPRDGVLLRAARGPGPDDVSLSWDACALDLSVYRAADPVTVAAPGNLLGVTAAPSWVDTPPPGQAYYYLVAP